MNTSSQNLPFVYHPNYLIGAPLGQPVNQIEEWNSMFKQCKEFSANMQLVYRQTDLYLRREIISRYRPQELVHFGNKQPRLFPITPDDFCRVSRYAVNETGITQECVELFMCTHILGASWGRFTVVSGNQHEASVIHALGIANSGQRKSAVNDRLLAPFLGFEKEIKTNYNSQSGLFSKKLASCIPKRHIKQLLDNVDFNNPEEVKTAIKRAQSYDNFYKELRERKETPPNINVTEATSYQLAKIMENNGGAQLMASAEGGGLEKLLFNQASDLVLKSYGQEPYVYANAKSHIELHQPALNIAVFGQFWVAMKLYSSPKLFNRGSLARIMPFVNVNSYPFSYTDLRGDEEVIYDRKIIKLLQNFYTRDTDAKRYIVRLDNSASNIFLKFREELESWDHGLTTFRPWVAKLHGQTLRLALAIHLWEHPEASCDSLINCDDILAGIEIARNTVNSAFFLHSPYGLRSTFAAIEIIESFQRITGYNEQENFLLNGTDTRGIQQRTKIDRININNALQLLSWRGFVAIYDDGHGNLRVLPHSDFFRMKVSSL